MKKFIINTLFAICVVLMACGTASAQAFYSNLDQIRGAACGFTEDYIFDNGTFIFGPENCFSPGIEQGIAWPFTTAIEGTVGTINLLVTGHCDGPGGISVGIWADDCFNAPSRLLARKQVRAGSFPFNTTVNVPFADKNVHLDVATRYWLVVEARAGQPKQVGTAAVWWAPMNAWKGIAFGGSDNGFEVESEIGPGGFAVLQ